MLGGHQTIPPDRGIFLPRDLAARAGASARSPRRSSTRAACDSRPGLERQALVGAPPFDGAGLWVVAVAHDGNQNSLDRGGRRRRAHRPALLRQTARAGSTATATRTPLTPDDILVVAPYNAQVALLGERLEPRGIRVGTVDKFQGQEAPVVIYSMATSTPEDAPRGMEFLYSLNRLNVATSRARCACILVASPRLFEPECKSPRQMQLANALCRYVELAKFIDPATL